MIIQGIHLNNFKNYRGPNSLDLDLRSSEKNGRNIVLIGGMNGAGKTSVMEALRLCLYGSRGVVPRMTAVQYEGHVLARINKDALADGENHASVGLDIVDDRNGISLELNITRSWSPDSKGHVHEELSIRSNGRPFELVSSDSWEELLSAIIPPYVSSLFFFDGERIKEVASGEESNRIFHDAIYDLLGISGYDTLSRDLQTLAGIMKRRNLKDKDTQRILDSLRQEVEKIAQGMREISTSAEQLEKRIEDLVIEQNSIETEIRRRIKESASSIGDFKSKIAELEAREKEIANTVRDLCESNLPLLIASKVASSLLTQLRRERQAKERTAAKGFLRDVEWELISRVTGNDKLLRELDKQQIAAVERELKVVFEKFIEGLSASKEDELLHDLSTTDSGKLEFVLTSVRSESESRLRELLQEREKVNLEINLLYAKLKGLSDEVIDSEVSRLGEIRAEVGKMQHELGMVIERKNRLESDLAKKDDDRARLEEKLECADEDRMKMELIDRTVRLLEEHKRLQISRRIGELENLVTKFYRRLANKGDMVRRIEISEEDFGISLIDRRGARLEREIISAGEQ
jgi:DNA sulfur modification protein DndD